MGRLHELKGIIIYLFTREHNPPHIHARYAEFEALIVIKTGKILRGKLPNQQLKIVQEWLDNPERQKKLVEMFHRMNPNLRGG